MSKPTLIVYCDGLCEPVNPGGTACYGWVVYRSSGERITEGTGICPESGKEATNNVAEYSAVIAALEWLASNGLTKERVRVRGDSRLVINQLSGMWNVNAPNMRVLYLRVKELARNFEHVGYQWIPREENTEADALSREAYRS